MDKQNKTIISSAVFLIILVIVFALLNSGSSKVPSGKFDSFAQCLTEKGAVMYGAEWCPHCKANKAAFGDAVKFINYVECPDNTQLCIDKGIQGYPTWIVGTSTKIEGFEEIKTFEDLSAATGCAIPLEE